MITDRFITEEDVLLLGLALAKDEHHQGTEVEFFYQPGTLCKVYEDDLGPVLFARASKSLRLDLQYVSNSDAKRNLKVMMSKFPELVEKARENGFNEICFVTDSPLLKKFCEKHLGFEAVAGHEMRRFI